MASQWMYPSSTDMNTYSAPDRALTGNRPVKSECAVCERDSVSVKTVLRGDGGWFASSESSG